MRTKNQETLDKILKFVNKYYQENHASPTINDVAEGVGVARSTTHRYLQELSERDLIDYKRGILSAPLSAKMKTAYVSAPLVGSIRCGSPEEEEESIENLIEMREDGDVDKEYFRNRKKEIEEKIYFLTEEIKSLTPFPQKDFQGDFSSRLKVLKRKLEKYTKFDDLVIPESVVEAFIEKIWVSKDEFRWYMRTGKENDDNSERYKIGSFTLSLEDAKAYQYSFSTRKRIYNWVDLNISIWI